MKPEQFPPIAAHVLVAPIADGAAVYDLATEQLARLNEAAAVVFSACIQTLDRTPTETLWAESTGEHVDVIAADVDAMIKEFTSRGWIGDNRYPRLFRQNAPVTALAHGEAQWIQAAGLHRIRWRSDDEGLVVMLRSAMECTDGQPDHGRIGHGRKVGREHSRTSCMDSPSVGSRSVASAMSAEGMGGAVGMGAAIGNETPSADFSVTSTLKGVTLKTDSDWKFQSPEAMLSFAMRIVNDWVTRTEAEAVMHAAVAQAPDGRVIAVSANAGSGKSTLIGALVQRGWTYVTDEAATIVQDDLSIVPYLKPLDLDARSREALGIAYTPQHGDLVPPWALGSDVAVANEPVPTPDAVILTNFTGSRFAELHETGIETLSGFDALGDLVRNTLNLRYVGTRGLETLVALWETTPVYRISYDSTEQALAQLAELGLV